jgi:prophage regulatory protein
MRRKEIKRESEKIERLRRLRAESLRLRRERTADLKERLLYKPEVLDITGLTYVTLWKWMQRGDFPRSRDLGGKSAWLKSEIDAWIADRPVRRLKGDKAA